MADFDAVVGCFRSATIVVAIDVATVVAIDVAIDVAIAVAVDCGDRNQPPVTKDHIAIIVAVVAVHAVVDRQSSTRECDDA